MALTQSTVASNDLGITLATNVLKNLYATNFTPDGYVVNNDYQGFSTSTFTVGITRIARPGGSTRTIGGNGNNNGFFNTSDVKEPTNGSDALFMNRIYDQVFDIAYTLEDSVPYSYVASLSEGIASEVGEQLGKDTIDEMYNNVKAVNTNIIKYGAASDNPDVTDIYLGLTKANTILSNGKISAGDRAAPATGRAAVLAPEVFELLLSSQKYILTGSDRAFAKLESGFEGIANETFKGVIAGISTFECPASLMPEATTGTIYGFVVHKSAVTRAFYDRGIQVIACPRGQGMRLLPYYRWGVKAVRPHFIVGLVSANWTQA